MEEKDVGQSACDICIRIRRGYSHLPLQSFRLQAECCSTVVTFELDSVVGGGEGRLSVGGCLKSSILQEKISHEQN